LHLRVLLMQLTTRPEDGMPRGNIDLWLLPAGATVPFSMTDQTWDSLEGFGLCCLPDNQCRQDRISRCWAAGGVFVGHCGSLCADFCPLCADVDGDRDVDVDDLQAVILAWGECAECQKCPADVNVNPAFPALGDCNVNVDDLVAVILGWGPCP
jgi:hypothetical protein